MLDFQNEFSEDELLAISKEFPRLGDNTYLDHCGTTLYADSQIDNVSKVLKENLFCNPHTCKASGDLVDQVRYKILKTFNTTANEHTVIFTSGATAALKLLAETFEFGANGSFHYCQQNHTSVLGMRQIVRTDHVYVLKKDELEQSLKAEPRQNEGRTVKSNSLVTFSAQCNFSGYKMPLDLVRRIQGGGLVHKGSAVRKKSGEIGSNEFYVCLDAAAFVGTSVLDLSEFPSDFVAVSFYKMFGYPTGLGALIVSARGQNALQKQFYGGGTVNIAMSLEDFHEKREGLSQRFEDGTLSFLGVAGLLEGFRMVERLIPSRKGFSTFERISRHVFSLAKYCHDSLKSLKHANGRVLVKFYNHSEYKSKASQGGVCTFNILHDDGRFVGFAEVACIAAVYNVQLRTGCFCNPGACQELLELSNEDIRSQYEAGHICSDYNDLINGVPTGAVRVSFGYMTRKEDVDRLVQMISENYLRNQIHRREILQNSVEKLPKVLRHIPERYKQIRLRKICVYPIKSCGAFEITSSWELTGSGLKYDRGWMIIDANGTALTQKSTSRMCLIRPRVDLLNTQLEISFPEMDTICVSLEARPDANRIESAMCQSKVCGDLVEGSDCGDAVADWLSKALQISGLRLVKQETERKTKRGAAKNLTLVNQAQFLLVNYTSVGWLAEKVEDWEEDRERTVDRFRGNLVIETPEPLEENQFTAFNIGKARFNVDGFCTRCQMICIDQHTGEKTTEPLKTIAREFQGKIRFGIYLTLQNAQAGSVLLSCQDEVVVEN